MADEGALEIALFTSKLGDQDDFNDSFSCLYDNKEEEMETK